MRLWSLHPKYLDAKGLVALWREALLAQAVLRGRTQGYKRHPQLHRFRSHDRPVCTMNGYLSFVYFEAVQRGYAFDRGKIGRIGERPVLDVTAGQLEYEWEHLMHKLFFRARRLHRRWRGVGTPEPHPLFRVRSGPVEHWEVT